MRKSYNSADNSFLDSFGEFLSIRNILKGTRNALIDNNSKLLDLGCGFHSTITKPIWHRFSEVHLVDFEINTKIENKDSNLNFHPGDVLKIISQFQNESFRIVVANNLLEHVFLDLQLTKEIFRVLEQGGILLANVPNWQGKKFLEISAFKFGLSPSVEIEDHCRYYSKNEFWLLMRSAGFSPSNISVNTVKFGLNTFAVCKKV